MGLLLFSVGVVKGAWPDLLCSAAGYGIRMQWIPPQADDLPSLSKSGKKMGLLLFSVGVVETEDGREIIVDDVEQAEST